MKRVACAIAALLACFFAACHAVREHRAAGTLTIGARGDDYIMRPDRSQLGLYPLSLNICEPLVRLASDYTVQPLLATRWEYRGNNTWRFHLRPGVRFSNGQPLTSEAVRWTIAVAARREPHTFLYADSVKIVDALTVDLTPRQTNLRLLDQLVIRATGSSLPAASPRPDRSVRARSSLPVTGGTNGLPRSATIITGATKRRSVVSSFAFFRMRPHASSVSTPARST